MTLSSTGGGHSIPRGVLSIVLSASKFESPVCEGGLMGSRFKDRELGAIEATERGGAEAGAAGGVSFCDDAGC